MESRRRIRPTSAVLLLAVLLLTVVTFAPALRNQFVGLDDGTAFVGNVAYRGLGWPQLRWMFTTALLENYVPVAWLSLGLDYRLWGMDPAGYHLTSVLLHAVGAGLFYLVALHNRKSTRLNSSHLGISYAVFCLKKKT